MRRPLRSVLALPSPGDLLAANARLRGVPRLAWRHAARLARAWPIAIALAGAACAGKLDRPERFDSIVASFGKGGTGSTTDSGMGGADAGPALPACVKQIFGQTCGVANCHAAGTPQVDLASSGVAARLVDQKSTSVLCMDLTYISTSGGSSLLLDKLGATPPCGSPMPLTGMLSSQDVKCLTDWVISLGGSSGDGGAMH